MPQLVARKLVKVCGCQMGPRGTRLSVTAMEPGPAVKGMVSGKKALSSR